MRSLKRSRRAEVQALVLVAVAAAVTLIIVAGLLPTAIEQMEAVNTANWSTGSAAIWPIIYLIALVGILLAIVGFAVKAVS